MIGNRRISLSSAPFFASVIVIFSLGIFIGIFWMVNEYEAYMKSIENIRKNYKSQYRHRVQEELGKAIEFIEYKRAQADFHIENEIREKVQSAYSIASHIYSRHKDEMSPAELREMVAEVLRPIRWNNGNGYYFAGQVESGVIDLFADDPIYEGKSLSAIKDGELVTIIGKLRTLARDKGAGIYRYDWSKPQFEGEKHAKISFVKYFKPFDWYIGAGVYLDDIEEMVQREALTRIQNIHFGQDGEIITFRIDGTIIGNSDERLIGRSIEDFVGYGGEKYGRKMWQAGLREREGAYVGYGVQKAGSSDVYQKLSFVKSYDDWGWVLGASMFMDDMEKAIKNETNTYMSIAFKNITLFIVLFIVAVSLLLCIAFYYSFKIKQGIALFTNFFKKAAHEQVKIEKSQFAFAEFEDLGTFANQLVDDIIQKEQLIRRDELRLDTLLQLGMMENHSLQEKYDFILQRIVQITGSDGGYLALVNTNQTHLNLYSFVAIDEKKQISLKSGTSYPVTLGGVAGKAVVENKAILCNDNRKSDTSALFPYRKQIVRHLDVPIFNSGKIVIVAGVCNNTSNYNTSDIRQITMVLEGLWLHVLKMCSEKELERLEREVIAVSEMERNAIGRDLHDDLGSHLSGVEMLSKVLQKKLEEQVPDKAKQLGVIRDLLRDAIEKIRRLAKGLYPVHVIEQGLEASIEKLVVEVESLFSLQCRFSFEGTQGWSDHNIATHMYYIIREAVFNAARHGKPEHIMISLNSTDDHLLVTIHDDGCGFQDGIPPQGMGLNTMKYRAKAIGATLTIASDEESGTLVSINGEV